MDSIYLHGSEAVEKAGYTMARTADEMKQAARNMEGALIRHQQWMDDWLYRLQQVMERKP